MHADRTYIEVRAGCSTCDPHGVARWDKHNALAVAARHHAATGHETWAEQTLTAHWGTVHVPHLDQLQLAI